MNVPKTLLCAALLLAGLCGLACAPSTVLPPAASISAPPPNGSHIGNLGRHPQSPFPLPGVPFAGPDSWKPTVPARHWQYVVVHHTATNSGSVETIHESHLKNKDKNGNPWLGIGYHFVIGNGQGMSDGAIEPTFRWRTQIQGAHAGSANKDYNERGIGVCLVGNFEHVPPTAAQRRSVRLLIQTLKREYTIPSVNVVGHKDIRASATECPGKLFPMADLAADEPTYLFGRQPASDPIDRVADSSGSTLR